MINRQIKYNKEARSQLLQEDTCYTYLSNIEQYTHYKSNLTRLEMLKKGAN